MNSTAFKKYATPKFIDLFADYLPGGFDINRFYAESDVAAAMCQYFTDKIRLKFDFNDIKSSYKKEMRNISPNLDYVQTKKKINRAQTKLETYAKLKYNLSKISDFDYDLDVAICLYTIYCKLNKKSTEAIINSKVFTYLSSACAEKFPKLNINAYEYFYTENLTQNEVNPDEIVKFDLPTLANKLQERIVINDFIYGDCDCFAKLSNEGILTTRMYNSTLPYDYDFKLDANQIEQYLQYPKYSEENAIFIENLRFKKRLSDEMHTLENGMVF